MGCSVIRGIFPYGTVYFLVKGRTSSGKLSFIVMFSTHKCCAVRKGSANLAWFEYALFKNGVRKVRIGKRSPADSNDRDISIFDLGCGHMLSLIHI